MGSVIDYIACPNCGTEAYNDFYYRTGEEYTNCNNCGYHYSATIINRDKKLTELTESDWKIEELKNPYGAYRYKMAGEVSTTCGSLVSEEDANRFKTEMKLEYQDHVEFAQISRLLDGEIVVEDVV
jgi:Zn ribbon nucleic-acid-binding protein